MQGKNECKHISVTICYIVMCWKNTKEKHPLKQICKLSGYKNNIHIMWLEMCERRKYKEAICRNSGWKRRKKKRQPGVYYTTIPIFSSSWRAFWGADGCV